MTFTEPPAWHQHAACAGTDPDLFFPGRGQPITDARRVCATCTFVSSPSGTGSHQAAHRRRAGAAA